MSSSSSSSSSSPSSSSITSPTPTTSSSSTPPPPYQQQQLPKTSNLAILILIASPLIAFLPPRKLDTYTFCLGSAFVLSAGHIYTSDSPTSSRLRRFVSSSSSRHKQSPPPLDNDNYSGRAVAAAAAPEVEREEDREGDRDREVRGGGGVKAMAKKLWMGDEMVGWEERRVAREREVLDEGGGVGYGELIGESIMDVFGREKKEEEGKAD